MAVPAVNNNNIDYVLSQSNRHHTKQFFSGPPIEQTHRCDNATIAKKSNPVIIMPQPTPQEPTTITHAKQISYAQALPPSNNYHPAPVQSPTKINKKHPTLKIPSCWQYQPSFLSSIKMVEQLKILYWNCQGLGNKKFELIQFIQRHKIHIILLNETYLKPITLLKLPNYHTYRNDRPTPPGQSGTGGTGIL
ncbi:hypothetical protein QTP88_006957 [Uroleucon formosanum]